MPRAKKKTLDDYERRYHDLLEALADIGFVRSGSVAPRYNYCGKANCRCHGDPPEPHGPYLQWTAKVDGKTVNRRLSPRRPSSIASGSPTTGDYGRCSTSCVRWPQRRPISSSRSVAELKRRFNYKFRATRRRGPKAPPHDDYLTLTIQRIPTD